MTALVLTCAVLLDALLGEPRKAHPLMVFGAWAGRIERTFRGLGRSDRGLRWLGAGAWAVAVAPVVLLVTWLEGIFAAFPMAWLFDAAVVYLCLGHRSLHEHAGAVARALRAGDLEQARRATGALVSRDPARLSAQGCARATTETVLENSNDAVFATLFWYALLGAPGAVAHRLINTLDAMWGYRSKPWHAFGATAARADDLAAWLPARLSALTWAVVGPWVHRPGIRAPARMRDSLSLAWAQGRRWPGCNPGVVLAAGAGALGVRLGGPASYDDGIHRRPRLGPRRAEPASAGVIEASLRGLLAGLLCWLGVLALPGLMT